MYPYLLHERRKCFDTGRKIKKRIDRQRRKVRQREEDRRTSTDIERKIK